MSTFDFNDLGASLTKYKTFVEQHDLMLAPSVVKLLDKVDSIKDPEKRKGPIEDAVKALDTWVKTQKLSKEAAEAFEKMKGSIQGAPNKKGPPPAPPLPYKKTTFFTDLTKARAEVPFFGVAGALSDLDNAKTLAEAKPLAAAAQKALEKELAEIDAEVKNTKDPDRKPKVSAYGFTVRKLLASVKELAK